MESSVKQYLLILFAIISLVSCQTLNDTPKNEKSEFEINLMEFAHANCLFWYFKKMGYDTKDIRAIAGGIVEMGTSSADKYQKIALFVKDYKPGLKTKNNIDVDLLKCFHLDKSDELSQLISSMK